MLPYYLSILETPQEQQQFINLYETYHTRLLQIAYSLLPSSSMAEDAVHDTFLKIILHFDQISQIPSKKQRSWIVTILKNTCFDLLRKNKQVAGDTEAILSAIPDCRQDVEADIRYQLLLDAIHNLSADDCELLELKFIMGWPDKEIAQALRISPNAVSVRVHRAKKRLRNLLEQEGHK